MQVGLLNVDGYYDSLLTFIDKAVEEEFICPNAPQIFVSAPNATELLNKLEVKLIKTYSLVVHTVIIHANVMPIYKNFIHGLIISFFFQGYFPSQEIVTSKLKWENEELDYSSESHISSR